MLKHKYSYEVAKSSFGRLAVEYDKFRRGFSENTISFVAQQLSPHTVSVLDVGCGTGIATRQLAALGFQCVGCDIDAKMIEVARRNVECKVSYITAPAENLPFAPASYDAITAFSSFHWFANRQALEEICRVLRPGGKFIVVNKDDGSFNLDVRRIVENSLRIKLPSGKQRYVPGVTLNESKFENITQTVHLSTERFLPFEAVNFVKSTFWWNLIPKRKHAAVSKLLFAHFSQMVASDGRLERPIETRVVVGTLPLET